MVEPDTGSYGGEAAVRFLLNEAAARFREAEIQNSAASALQAAEHASRARRPDLIAEAALIVVGVPDPAAAAAVERMAREALAGLGDDNPAILAGLHGQLAVALHHRERLDEAAAHTAEALAFAERAGDPTASALALHAKGLNMAGHVPAAALLAVGDRMLDAALASGSPDLELMARSWRVEALIRSGETAQAGHEIDALAVIGTRSGRPLAKWNTHLARAGLAHAVGRFAEAEEEARLARGTLPPSQRSQTEPLFVAQLTLVATDRGIAPAELDVVRGFAIGLPLIAIAMTGRYDLEVGDVTRAHSEFDLVRERIDAVTLDRRGLPTLAGALELAVAFEDATLSAELADRLRPFDGAMIASSVGAVGPVAYFLARAEASLGEHDAAVRHIESAITLSGRGGFAPWVARSRLAHAEALLRRNRTADRDLAIRSARLAAASAERLGMSRLLARAQHLLGGVEGRERLTPRELEVVALVAAGSTNREIAARLVLSDRTVETHVQNILGKLGFRSRAEIAAWAARERIGDEATT